MKIGTRTEVTLAKRDIQNCCVDGKRVFLYPGEDVHLNAYRHRVFRTNFGKSYYQSFQK